MQEPRWWNRLGVRLPAVIAVVTVATVGLFAALVLRTQERHLVGQVVESAALLSDTVKRSTYHDMLEDRREDVYLVMDTIGGQEGIETVRIFNKDGRITFSTDRRETDTLVDTQAESCYACHAAGEPLARLNIPSRSRIYERNHHRVLGMVTPIYNEPSCSTAACHAHPPEQSVLGVIDITMSLEPIDDGLARLRRATLGLSALAVFGLAGFVTLLARRSVVSPVTALVRGTQQIATGDLKLRVPVRAHDELGQLADSFNEMADSLAKARQERLQLLESLEQQVQERTAALARATDRMIVSEKLSSLGRLAASVAHEINNPLAGILTYAKLLIRTLDDGQVSERERETALKRLRLIERETERCSAIVRNLLDFARERPLTISDVSINAALDEALTLVAHQAKLQDIELAKELGNVPLVSGDFGQLRQAFINIIINACDAMHRGGRLTIRTSLDPAASSVEVVVSDTGTGIPAAIRSKVLDPFFTTKEKGTGLGLSVVYGIVERHGGTIEIESEEGAGTTVVIGLPVVQSVAGATLAPVTKPGPAGSGEPSAPSGPFREKPPRVPTA
jgi:two-component system, NtrC family, sensor kinase